MLNFNSIIGNENSYVSFAEVALKRLDLPNHYAAKYVDGRHGEANLTSNPKLGASLRIVGDGEDYHSYLIHEDDVDEFVRRVRAHKIEPILPFCGSLAAKTYHPDVRIAA